MQGPDQTAQDDGLGLSDILITDQLRTRTPRPPDTGAEIRALRRISAAFGGPPADIIQTLVDTALELSHGGTTGLSVLHQREDGTEYFRWDALAGGLAAYVGGTTPRDFSPCGTTLDRGVPQLFDRPARYFTYLQACGCELHEALIVPIYSASGPIGTLWVVNHEPGRTFDSEDVRLFTTLAAFTAAGIAGARLQQAERAARELAERTAADLRERSVELERSNRDLEDFSYICSHDLREPLRGIRNYIAFIREDHAIESGVDEKLRTIERLTDRMGVLLHDLLEYSRAGRAEIAIVPADTRGIVEAVLESLEHRIGSERAEVTIETELPVLACDPARIGEVFANLIVNALKYNASDPKRVAIGCRRQEGRQPVLYVRDNGIGIPPAHAERIFRMFKRLHARDAYGGGTGSGLAIVRKIIDRHHGEVWAEPGPEGGTILCFTLGRPETLPDEGPTLFDLLRQPRIDTSCAPV